MKFNEISNFWNFLKILKSYEHFEFVWNFWNFEIFKNFRVFVNRRWSPSVPNKYKLLSNPVAELKVRENDSHWRSIVLKTMDRSIVKQLEKEKNFNVENFVVMFIYWGTVGQPARQESSKVKSQSCDFRFIFDEKWRSTLRLKYVGLQ